MKGHGVSDSLVEFLRARLDEDEQAARAASGPKARYPYWALSEWQGREEPHSLIGQGTPEHPTVLGHFTYDPIFTTHAEHIVRHDPARVLAEVEAKRRIVFEVAMPVLALLALPYADHPDYREEWRP